MDAPAQIEGTPLSDLFWTASVELGEVRQVVERLEALVSASALRSEDPGLIEQAQETDAVLQRLRGLGDFFLVLAHTAPPEMRLRLDEALDRMTLHALRARLGGPLDAPLPDSDAQSGDFELL